jgi:DNA-binding transcriptional regulator YdaS (Cro superfamily)
MPTNEKWSSPLGQYLLKQKMTQTEFARRLGKLLGVRIWTHVVSRWATGAVAPRSANRLAIEKATRGGVPMGAWK